MSFYNSSPPAPGISASPKTSLPVVLSIAGYDPSAGAGVLADLKTFAAHGVYGMACITAITIQSTQGVRRVKPLPPDTVTETLDCLAGDVSFVAVKVGMLGTSTVAQAVLDWLQSKPELPVVLDPVLKSSSGKDLLDSGGITILRRTGLARVNWITPNLPELEALTGHKVSSGRAGRETAAARLLQLATEQGNPGLNIVVTGGHADKPDDLLLNREGAQWFPGQYIDTRSTHGTGCAFSSALAAALALGAGPESAVRQAKDYVTGALRHAISLGQGKGPLRHDWNRVDRS